MGLTYFKRFRMEIGLRSWRGLPVWARSVWDDAYELVAWTEGLLDSHAEAKYHSFRNELDANVFPCLGDFDGCRRLMTEISQRTNFVPGATWLARFRGDGACEECGTVQGVSDQGDFGAIQNLGVTSSHRGRGLGTRLLAESLTGFREAGLTRAYLEVTARNDGAIRLYQRFGFRTVKTLYKAADVAVV
ncbi:MAG: GNAT family N-acetyltransferase [Planctomycetes bacterium]|nr:GNAT family N-acetyltransferase [Planctomycetota bacterium]